MDPENQPGSLGFAYIPIVSGAIDTANQVLHGVFNGVIRDGDGIYRFNFDNPSGSGFPAVSLPANYCITPIADPDQGLHPFTPPLCSRVFFFNGGSPLIPGVIGVCFLAPDGTPTDPEAFTFSIMGT